MRHWHEFCNRLAHAQDLNASLIVKSQQNIWKSLTIDTARLVSSWLQGPLIVARENTLISIESKANVMPQAVVMVMMAPWSVAVITAFGGVGADDMTKYPLSRILGSAWEKRSDRYRLCSWRLTVSDLWFTCDTNKVIQAKNRILRFFVIHFTLRKVTS